jgi:hypothetical protein
MTDSQTSDSTRKPVYAIKYGNVRAAIWANNSMAGYFYNTTFSRLYRDKETDAWGDSTSFGDNDLLNLAKAATDAHSWIFARKGAAVVSNGHTEEPEAA